MYGHPQPTYYKPVQYPYHPRDHLSILHKLKTKINLFTIGKIILKLLIFKKIIKFIGVICLLLFLPKLKDMFKEEPSSDEDGMESKQVETEQGRIKYWHHMRSILKSFFSFLNTYFLKFPNMFFWKETTLNLKFSNQKNFPPLNFNFWYH